MSDLRQKLTRPAFAAIIVGALLFPAVAFYLLHSHVRAARSINVGDTQSTVHKKLWVPSAVVTSISEPNITLPQTTSYTFRSLDRKPLDMNNKEFRRAEWFEMGSAGYLVIYGDDGVVRVIWGGT